MEPRLKRELHLCSGSSIMLKLPDLIFQVASIKVGIPLTDFRNVYHRPLSLPKDCKILSQNPIPPPPPDSSCGIHSILVCFGVISSFCLFVFNDLCCFVFKEETAQVYGNNTGTSNSCAVKGDTSS